MGGEYTDIRYPKRKTKSDRISEAVELVIRNVGDLSDEQRQKIKKAVLDDDEISVLDGYYQRLMR